MLSKLCIVQFNQVEQHIGVVISIVNCGISVEMSFQIEMHMQTNEKLSHCYTIDV